MIYLSRALHFFIKIVVVITLAFGVMYLFGWLDVADGQFAHTLLNTPRGWIVMAAIVVISVAYPSLSFARVAIRGDFDGERGIMDKVTAAIGYKSVHVDADRTEYRAVSIAKRIFNQFDDRITVSREGSYIIVSGLKKEVVRIESLFTQCRLNDVQE